MVTQPYKPRLASRRTHPYDVRGWLPVGRPPPAERAVVAHTRAPVAPPTSCSAARPPPPPPPPGPRSTILCYPAARQRHRHTASRAFREDESPAQSCTWQLPLPPQQVGKYLNASRQATVGGGSARGRRQAGRGSGMVRGGGWSIERVAGLSLLTARKQGFSLISGGAAGKAALLPLAAAACCWGTRPARHTLKSAPSSRSQAASRLLCACVCQQHRNVVVVVDAQWET